jgi:hypothetical protein
MGLTGYDNLRKQYVSVWIDNMSTGVMVANGRYYPEAKALIETGTMSDPATGDPNSPFRGVWTFVNQDYYTYEMYTIAPNGREYKSMEISYSRVP